MTVDLLALLSSGELARLARTTRNGAQLAARLGMSSRTYREHVQQLRAQGVAFPTIPELLRGETPLATPANDQRLLEAKASLEFADEDPTDPGFSPPAAILPSGHSIRGVSSYVDGDGNLRGQWIKTHTTEQQRWEAFLAALPALVEPYGGIAEPAPRPEHADEDLLAVYTLGDPHFGMHAWGEETGQNFDLAIAEREMLGAVEHLVSVAPRAKRAVILDLGDFFHFDNQSVTTTGGTRQDGDTRWSKVLRVGIRAMRRATDLALAKHELVEPLIVPGNHDLHTSTALALALEQFYERDPRVRVDTSPDPFKWIEHDKTLILATHGHDAKPERLMGVMATDRPEAWARALYRYILTGHVHHSTVKELPGCTVETFPTLASRDAWHHGQGYRAQQTMCVDTYHREWGRVNRSTVGVRQVRAK